MTDTLPSELSKPKGSFDFQGTKLLLTYPCHCDKERLIGLVTAAAPGGKLSFARVAHETGQDGYRHSHLLVNFGKVAKIKNCSRFDVVAKDVLATGEVHDKLSGDIRSVTPNDTLHPNWRPVKTITHWNNCCRYLAKEDPANADLATLGGGATCGRVWNAPTLHEALANNVEKFSDVLGVIQLFAARPRECVRPLPEPNPWQSWALDLIEEKPHPRHIHWIYDPVGNTGKTQLADHLASLGKAYVVETVGSSRDFATIISNALNSGWNGHCCIFDLPRVCEQREIYGPIESVKNGRVTATKYQGGTLFLPDRPHVFVFANFLPDYSKLSHDRWVVLQVCREDLTLLVLSPTNKPTGVVLTGRPRPERPEPRLEPVEDNIKPLTANDVELLLTEYGDTEKTPIVEEIPDNELFLPESPGCSDDEIASLLASEADDNEYAELLTRNSQYRPFYPDDD